MQECFKDEAVAVPLELLHIYDQLTRNESSLSSPRAEYFNKCRDQLLSMKTPPSSVVSSFMEHNNTAIDFLLTDTY